MATLYLGVEARDDTADGIDGKGLLRKLLARFGSTLVTSQFIGVADRNVQRWLTDGASPRPESIERMWAALDGDDVFERADRIRRYAKIASRGEPLFQGVVRRSG